MFINKLYQEKRAFYRIIVTRSCILVVLGCSNMHAFCMHGTVGGIQKLSKFVPKTDAVDVEGKLKQTKIKDLNFSLN